MQTTEKLTTLREKLRDAGMDGYKTDGCRALQTIYHP